MSDPHTHHAHTEGYRRGDDSPEAIEHEIDAERRNVSQTIEALQEKLSVGSMVDEAWRKYGHYGNDIGRNLGRAATENPLPLILTGVGLAWLMFGSSRRGTHDYDFDEDRWESDDEEDFVGTRHYASTHARPYGTAAVAGPYERRRSMTDRIRDAAGSAYESARDAVSSATHRASSAGHSAYDGARGMAGSASHHAGNAAAYASESGRGATGSVSRAVGSMGDAARHAGDMANRTAEEARRRAAYYGRYSRRRVDDMMEDHPLVMGALALVVGAAIGGALPRSRVEDEYLGEYSDEAWQMAQREGEKARRVAGAVAGEARTIAEEAYDEVTGEARNLADRVWHDAEHEARDAAERARTEAREAADRLAEKAREEARRQELGNPSGSA